MNFYVELLKILQFCDMILEHMKKDEFDFLRENVDFIKIESELEQYAKKWSVGD